MVCTGVVAATSSKRDNEITKENKINKGIGVCSRCGDSCFFFVFLIPRRKKKKRERTFNER